MYSEIPDWVMGLSTVFIAIAFLLAFFRLLRGPLIADRVLALDLISGLCLATLILVALESDNSTYLNVAMALAVISFLGTVALARYLDKGRKQP